MWQLFTAQSNYKKRARTAAMLWCLLIFFLCFLPGHDVPEVDIPFADKWVHFILFGTLSFLCLCGFPSGRLARYAQVFLFALAVGWLVEELQGYMAWLGRSKDYADIAADAFGGLLGEVAFYALQAKAIKLGKQDA